MINISDEELNSITRAIYSRYGIDFTNYEPISLKRRISRMIRNYDLESSLGLWQKIIYEKEFINVFITEVSVGLTEMFRNYDFWIKVREDILPKINDNKKINIWHAACSTGEEAYSMAISLTESDMIGKSSVISTDINHKYIKQAREGYFSSMYKSLYSKNYVAANGKQDLSAYYKEKDENMVFNKLNMKNFRFLEHNLLKPAISENNDFILCRNVLIYFDETLKIKVLAELHKSLKEGGFLALGYYDSIPDASRKLFKPYDPKSKIYIKSLA